MVSRNLPRNVLMVPALLLFAAGCSVSPEPFESEHHVERSQADLEYIRTHEFVPTGPVTLHEAMARAVVFNLNRRVSEIEREIAESELERSNYEMLPELNLNVEKRIANKTISTSDDRITQTANATLVWNFLDLGVSYARAKQQADEVLIAKEQERKAFQDIIRQVNAAYWRAVTAEQLMVRVRAMAQDLQSAVRESRDMERTGTTDVPSAVAFRREIIESVRQVLTIQRELHTARNELAELINIRPGTKFELAQPKTGRRMPRLPMSLRKMETFALEMRPELRIEDYNERVSEWQAREALYRMLPGLSADIGQNYSSESTNLAPNWINTGYRLGMNLFSLFSGSAEIETAQRRGALARQRRLAVSLAVLTQLHLANIEFRNAVQQMRLTSEIAESDRRLVRLIRADRAFMKHDFFEAVRVATQQLRSEMEEQTAYVELMSSHAELMHAIGMDVVPETIPLRDISKLTEDIGEMIALWQSLDARATLPPENAIDRLVNNVLVETPMARGQRGATPAASSREAPRPDGDGASELAVSSELALRLDSIAPATGGAARPVETRRGDPPPPLTRAAIAAAPLKPAANADAPVASAPPAPKPAALASDDAVPAELAEMPAVTPDPAPPAPVRIARAVAPGTKAAAPARPARGKRARAEPPAGAPKKKPYAVSLGVFPTDANAFAFLLQLGMSPMSVLATSELKIGNRPGGKRPSERFIEAGAISDLAEARRLCAAVERAGQPCQVTRKRD